MLIAHSRMTDVVYPVDTEARLATTCFRGPSQALAGNFSRWGSAIAFFNDPDISGPFYEDLRQARHDRTKTNGVEIILPTDIGWTSTDRLAKYPLDALEEFHLNKRSYGLRIKSNRTDLLAPTTNCVTIIYSSNFRWRELPEGGRERRLNVVIRSIYPGPDIGELQGDVSNREGIVFFDWNHPGKIAVSA